MRRRVLVTGATGFVGRHVVAGLLGQGHRLALVCRDPARGRALFGKDASLIPGDLAELGGLEGPVRRFRPDVGVHLAWQGIPDYSLAASVENLRLSIGLVDLLAKTGACERLLAAGTCHEYGLRRGCCEESAPPHPRSCLGWAKLSLYHYASMRCAESGMSLAWFRLFYVYGPHQRQGALIPSIAADCAAGRAPAIRNPFHANDFVHVEDVARAFALAVARPRIAGIFNLGSGSATPVHRVCSMVREASGRSAPTALPLRKGPAPEAFWAGISKARRCLGWRPMIGLSEGIRRGA